MDIIRLMESASQLTKQVIVEIRIKMTAILMQTVLMSIRTIMYACVKMALWEKEDIVTMLMSAVCLEYADQIRHVKTRLEAIVVIAILAMFGSINNVK
jgi:hypothetical protein